MYPQTHFLFAFWLGSLLENAGIIDFKTTIIIAIIATLIDFDHLLTYHKKYKSFDLKKTWNSQLIKAELRSKLHEPVGFRITTVLIALILLASPKLALILAIAYYSHYFLDHLHARIKTKSYQLNILGFVTKLSGFEIALDIFLIIAIIITSPVLRAAITRIF